MFSNFVMRLGKARRELLMHILSKPVGVHLDFLYFAHCTKNSGEDLQTLISLGEHVNKSLSKNRRLEEEELAIDPITFTLNCRFLCIHATTRG